MTDCPVCTLFIDWLHQRAATDPKAMQLLVRLEEPRQFCDQHAHYDRALFREFMSTLSQREGA